MEDTDRLGNLVISRDPQTGKYSGTCCGPPPILRWIRRPASPASLRKPVAMGRSLMRNNYLDFAPRVGLAYQINNKTVIRTRLWHLLQLHLRAGVAGYA